MTGKQPREMAASVRARLMNVAKLNNEAFDLVLVRFAIERLLYRLSQSNYRDRFVVKGGMMFQVWSNLSHRPTRDLELLSQLRWASDIVVDRSAIMQLNLQRHEDTDRRSDPRRSATNTAMALVERGVVATLLAGERDESSLSCFGVTTFLLLVFFPVSGCPRRTTIVYCWVCCGAVNDSSAGR